MAYRTSSPVGTSAVTTCSPLFPDSVPCTRPRRELRSPITSPSNDAGTVTSSWEIGSSTPGAALAMASCSPIEPAILKLISDESTGGYFPSSQVTLTSTTGKPNTPPRRILSHHTHPPPPPHSSPPRPSPRPG